MLTVTIQSAAVTDTLATLQRKMGNLQPAMQSIGQTLTSVSTGFGAVPSKKGDVYAVSRQETTFCYLPQAQPNTSPHIPNYLA